MSEPRTTTTPLEALVVTAMIFGMFIVGSAYAVANGFSAPAFSDASLIWMVMTEAILAMAAVGFLYLRGYAVASLVPAPTMRGSAAGVGLFAAAWIAGQVVAAPFAIDAAQQPIEVMLAQARVSMPVVVTMAMVNGMFEEVFLLGFLLRGLRGHGATVALSATLLVRVLCHLNQGPLGPIWMIGFVLTFGLYYLRFGELWPPVFAHVLWDIMPFVD